MTAHNDPLIETQSGFTGRARGYPNWHSKPGLRQARHLDKVITGFIMLLGLAIALYPVLSPYFYAGVQKSYIKAYDGYIAGMTEAEKQVQWERLAVYQDQITGRKLPEAYIQGSGVVYPADYPQVLDFDGMIGYLEIPAIKTTQAIFHGIEQTTIDRALGHHPYTAFPGGGPSSNCMLLGHNDTVARRLFSNLEKIQPGDSVTIHIMDAVYRYRITDTFVVPVEEVQSFAGVQEEKELVTLMCCSSEQTETHRFLAVGERIE